MQFQVYHVEPRDALFYSLFISSYPQILGMSQKNIVERNKDRIAGITNYHSIVAGMPIVTKSDADIIFACLADLEVHYEDTIIFDSLELNKIYYDIENWKVYRKDGSIVSKKKKIPTCKRVI